MPGSERRFKLGDRVLVAAVLRRRYEFARGDHAYERPYGKVWKRSPAKRLRGIVVGKRNLSDGVSNGNVPTWRRYTEKRRFGAYIVAFNLSARHEYVLPEHLLADTPENRELLNVHVRAICASFNLTPQDFGIRGEDIIDAEIVEEDCHDAPF